MSERCDVCKEPIAFGMGILLKEGEEQKPAHRACAEEKGLSVPELPPDLVVLPVG